MISMISRPHENEFAPYYQRYVSLVHEEDVLAELQLQITELEKLAALVAPDQEHHRYAPGKWSLREVIGHLIDGERVFGYRAFCFSRSEAASLPVFDENRYVELSGYDDQPLAELVSEFSAVRTANLLFLAKLTEPVYSYIGKVADNPLSVRALAFIMAGHVRHHINGMRSSYAAAIGVHSSSDPNLPTLPARHPSIFSLFPRRRPCRLWQWYRPAETQSSETRL
jgi:hypothetical protein